MAQPALTGKADSGGPVRRAGSWIERQTVLLAAICMGNTRTPRMPLLTKSLRAQLLLNGRQQRLRRGTSEEIDFPPVVKLFAPWGAATWLLTELDPEDEDTAFGLCDLGMGSPELGSVSLSELEAIRGPLRMRLEADRPFRPVTTLERYADDARRVGRIKA